MTAQKTEEEIRLLSEQSAQAKENLCEHVGTYRCPLNYYPKKKELDRLHKAYAKLDPRRRNKIFGRQMHRKIMKWEKILKTVPQKCTRKQNDSCKSFAGNWMNLEKEITDLKNQLFSMPDYNTFNSEFERKKPCCSK